MTPDYASFLATLPVNAVIFMAVLCRVAAVVMTMPGLGEQSAPQVIRAGVALTLAVLIFPVSKTYFPGISPDWIDEPAHAIAFLGSEILSGLLIGYLSQLMALSLPMAMQIISTFIGLSNVLQPDPALGAQTTAISRMASMLLPVIFLTSGLYALPLAALVGSYHVFPPGHFFPVADAAHGVTMITGQVFLLAFQLSMPFILIGTLWPVMLGLLSRVSPSLQVYSLAMPAQLLGGIILLALLLRGLMNTWQNHLSTLLSGLPGSSLL